MFGLHILMILKKVWKDLFILQLQKACELVLDLIQTIPENDSLDCEDVEKPNPTGSGRHLLMLQCTEKEILPYCIQLLVASLKVGIFKTVII